MTTTTTTTDDLLARLWGIVRNLGALAAVVTQAANVGGLPTAVRSALIAAGGLLLTGEHIAQLFTPAPSVAKAATGPTPAELSAQAQKLIDAANKATAAQAATPAA